MTLNNYNILAEFKQLATLLNGEVMHFDHSSYEYTEDIPHLRIKGSIVNIYAVYLAQDFPRIFIYSDCGQIQIDPLNLDISKDELEVLFRDIYYNHPQSWNIGDYELNFLL